MDSKVAGQLGDNVAEMWRTLEASPKRLADISERTLECSRYETWCCDAVAITLSSFDRCLYFMVQQKPERSTPYVNSAKHPGYRWCIRWVMP